MFDLYLILLPVHAHVCSFPTPITKGLWKSNCVPV